MTFTAIFAGIIAIAKAIPKVAEIINLFYDFYIDEQIKNITESQAEMSKQRLAVMNAIKKATNDEERIALSVTFAKLYRLSNAK